MSSTSAKLSKPIPPAGVAFPSMASAGPGFIPESYPLAVSAAFHLGLREYKMN